MNTLKAIQSSSPPRHPSFLHPRKAPTRKKSTLCFSNKNPAEPGEQPPPKGDHDKQELLVKIAQLQTQKARLTDYLDERSAYLTQFAEDANAEFDEIAENTLKGLEEASDRIMEKLENRMQAFEERAESNQEETLKNERLLQELEDQIDQERNEGLFFKSLRQKTPQEKVNARKEMEKVKGVARDNIGSKVRRNIYLALICLLIFTIGSAVVSEAEVEWRKITALGVILVGLFAQLVYEQNMSNAPEKTEEKED